MHATIPRAFNVERFDSTGASIQTEHLLPIGRAAVRHDRVWRLCDP